MELNKNNLFARYYNWIYDGLPNDICSFFWGSMFIILLFPFFAVGRLSYFGKTGWYYSADHSLGRGFIFWLVYFLTILVGGAMMSEFGYIPIGFSGFFLLAPIIGALTVALFLGVIGGSLGGVAYFIEKRRKNQYRPSPIKNWIGAIRGKYCTKITWK